MLLNKWKQGKVKWENLGPFPWSGTEGFSGIAPISVVLDQEIGTEVALYIFDYTPFAHDIAKLEPFTLYLKTGLVRCPSGVVYFSVFWLHNPANPQEPYAIYERIVDPNDSAMMQPYWELARQTHWHVFIVGPNDQCLSWFEIENVFELRPGLEALSKALPDVPTKDFEKSKLEFQEMFTLQELLNIDNS